MTCRYCATQIPNDAKYCTNCGRSVTFIAPAASATASSQPGKDLIFVVILLAWDYFSRVLFTIANNIIVPAMRKNDTGFDHINTMYRILSGATAGIAVILTTIFAVLAKSTLTRVLLIVFGFIHLVLTVIYYTSAF